MSATPDLAVRRAQAGSTIEKGQRSQKQRLQPTEGFFFALRDAIAAYEPDARAGVFCMRSKSHQTQRGWLHCLCPQTQGRFATFSHILAREHWPFSGLSLLWCAR
jgi:hypothetical protein